MITSYMIHVWMYRGLVGRTPQGQIWHKNVYETLKINIVNSIQINVVVLKYTCVAMYYKRTLKSYITYFHSERSLYLVQELEQYIHIGHLRHYQTNVFRIPCNSISNLLTITLTPHWRASWCLDSSATEQFFSADGIGQQQRNSHITMTS